MKPAVLACAAEAAFSVKVNGRTVMKLDAVAPALRTGRRNARWPEILACRFRCLAMGGCGGQVALSDRLL